MVSQSKIPVINPMVAGSDVLHRVRTWPNASWVETELQQLAGSLKERDTIAEVGIGAGSYARSLSLPGAVRVTLDLPVQSSQPYAPWPLADDSVDLLLTVDSLNYESDVESFVREAARVTRTTKLFACVARSRDDLQSDGVATFFPEAVERILPLVTETAVLEKMLEQHGLYCMTRRSLAGHLQIDEALLRAIAHRELTGLATLTEEEFAKGVAAITASVSSGDATWPSSFTMLVCRKVRPWKSGSTLAPEMGKM